MMQFTGFMYETLFGHSTGASSKMVWSPTDSKLCLATSLPNPLPIINPPGIVFPPGAVGNFKPISSPQGQYSVGLGRVTTYVWPLQTWAPAPGDPDSLVTALLWFDNPTPDQFYVYGVLPIPPAHMTQVSRLSVIPSWASSPDGFAWTGTVWGQ